jgi:NAD(P)H-dependent FMN reductase
VKLIAISASLTPGGRTRAALECAVEGARARYADTETDLLDLRDVRISFCDGRALSEYADDTRRVVEGIGTGDGFLLATPVYRGSYSGALKNLIDHLPVESLRHKPVGLIAVGATDHHYLVIDHALRSLLAWFGAMVAPGSVYVQGADFDGQALVAGRTRDHLRQLGESVVLLAARCGRLAIGPPPLPSWTRG